jgi:hypothetical protein
VTDITPLDDLDAQLGAVKTEEVEKTLENEHETEDVYKKEEEINE